VLIEGRPPEELLAGNPNLKAVVIPFAGLPPVTRERCLPYPNLSVYNLHHNAIITAEMAITLMLSAARFVVRYDRGIRNHDWSLRYQEERPSLLLCGKKVVLLGYGAIGKHVAKICLALGMQVEAIKRFVNYEGEESDGVRCYSAAQLVQRLVDAAVLMVVCPLTDETRGLIGEKQLQTMPAGGVLVNVGRAEIVAQEALYRALSNGHLAAAGLDVWYNYPETKADRVNTKPADFPFWEMDQVILSPHRGGHTQETELLRMQHLAVLLNKLAERPYPVQPVNLTLGY
jgi:phosphoglycerate dehydrogenase-like enzyme